MTRDPSYNRCMFDSLKGMAGMAGLLRDLPKIKGKMEEVKRELERVTVEAETGGGAVRVTANGQMQITKVFVDQAMMSALVDSANADDRAMARIPLFLLQPGAGRAAAHPRRQRERAGQILACRLLAGEKRGFRRP